MKEGFFTEFLNEIWHQLVVYAPSILMAILILITGLIIVHFINRTIQRTLDRSKVDPTLIAFIRPIVRITLYVVVAIIALSTAGVPTATLLTAFGAVGLAVSLAVKDSLANMAGGILLLVSKPFGIGDVVELDGTLGTVQEISILYTHINTFDNRALFLPNGQVTAGKIINVTARPIRRLDLEFGISYSSDFTLAEKIITDLVKRNPLAMENPAPIIRVNELGDSAVMITCWVWCKGSDYLTLKFNLLESVKTAFDENGISIPFPQLDVHLDPPQQ